MPKIDAGYNAMRTTGQGFDDISSKVDKLYYEVQRISRQIPLNTAGYRQIRAHLSTNGLSAIQQTSKKMQRIGEGLDAISKMYKFTDKSVAEEKDIEKIGEIIRNGVSEINTIIDIKNDWIKIKLEQIKNYFDTDYDIYSKNKLANYILNTIFGTNKFVNAESATVFSMEFLGLTLSNTFYKNYREKSTKLQLGKGMIKPSSFADYEKAKNQEYKDNNRRRDPKGTYVKPKEGDTPEKLEKVKSSTYASKAVTIAGINKSASKSWLHDKGELKGKYGSLSGTYDVSKGEAHLDGGVGVYTYKDADGKTHKAIGAGVDVGASYSVFEANGEARLGDKNKLGLYGKGYTKVGSASATGGVHACMTESGPQIYAGGKAELVAAEVGGSAGVSVLGADVGVKGSVKVGVGVEGKAGFRDGHFVMEGGVALGVGFSVGIDIDVSGVVNVAKDIGKGFDNIGKSIEKGWTNFTKKLGRLW